MPADTNIGNPNTTTAGSAAQKGDSSLITRETPSPVEQAGSNTSTSGQLKLLAFPIFSLILIGAFLISRGTVGLSYRLGYLTSGIFLSYFLVGTWLWFCKDRWSWLRFGIAFAVLWILIIALQIRGH